MQRNNCDLADRYRAARIGQAARPVLTSIIPIKSTDFSLYRSQLDIRRQCQLDDIETVIVDDGSPLPIAERIERFCDEVGFRYVRSGESDLAFSLSRSRNAGIRAARTEWVILEDADVVYSPSGLQRLVKEIALLPETPFNFVSVPMIYLARTPSQAILEKGDLTEEHANALVTQMLMASPLASAHGTVIQHYVPASGVIMTRRDTALDVGAFDEAFDGWGGEDRDFIYRLLLSNKRLNRPTDFALTINKNMNRLNAYRGWRSALRLHGDYLAAKGIYGFHLHHEPRPWKTPERTRENMELADHKAAALAQLETATSRIGNSEPSVLSPDSILMDRFRFGPVPKRGGTGATEAVNALEWDPFRRVTHAVAKVALRRSLSAVDRERLAHDPLEFFQNAKWGPNRFFGRLLLDRSQRPY